MGKPGATTHKEELVLKPRVSTNNKLSWIKGGSLERRWQSGLEEGSEMLGKNGEIRELHGDKTQ